MKKTICTMLVLVALLLSPSAYAATIAYSFDTDTIVPTDEGEEVINGYQANLTLTVLTNDSQPFTVSNIPGADAINVTVQFLDPVGNPVDVTGDGVEDTFTATENATQPGTYHVSINTSARPGEYTMLVKAVAYNSTSGATVDEGELRVSLYIADKYWTTVFADEGDKITIGSLSIELNTVNDRGAVVVLGDKLLTLSRDSSTGEIFSRVDFDGDGSNDGWMFIKSSEDGEFKEIRLYSSTDILPGDIDTIKVEGDTVTREAWVKSGSNYRQIVLWDQSPLSIFKAVDYYIIPAKGGRYWKESSGAGTSGRVAIIKRTTYLNILSRDEKIFDGNIYYRTVGDDILRVWGKWAGNLARLGSGWEIVKGITRLTYPQDYEIRYRNAAVPAELDFRGKIRLPSFGEEKVDWDSLIIGESE